MSTQARRHDYDCIVIGGGLVGAALAYGLAGRGLKTAVLDEGDSALRASRGNFGLVWVQGKGADNPEYARWSRLSAQNWTAFNAELFELTGVDPAYRQTGGVALALSEAELESSEQTLLGIRQKLQKQGSDYVFEVMRREQLLDWFPGLGEDVAGGTFCPFDGHVNPLRLLRALHSALQKKGVSYRAGHGVNEIAAGADGGFDVASGPARFTAEKVVLAAGLGNRRLGEQVGLTVPVAPLQGQLLITERSQTVMKMPTDSVRQTDEGTIQIGYSKNDAGFDTASTIDITRDIARRCLRLFPYLGQLRIVRSWAALRVMTPDGYPIYEQSATHPGAYVVTCHSGVTLAANHARHVAGWIAEGAIPSEFNGFNARRFDVSAHA